MQLADGHQRGTDKRGEHAKDSGTEESQIDQALADSFPASDAPPWTLGVNPKAHDDNQENRLRNRSDESKP